MVDFCVLSTRNRMICGGVIPSRLPFDEATRNLHRSCRWHSVTVMHINAIHDAASRTSDAPVIHQQGGRRMEDRRQRQWERCGQCMGVKHRRCCWLRWWMWRSQRWCVRRNRPMIFILFFRTKFGLRLLAICLWQLEKYWSYSAAWGRMNWMVPWLYVSWCIKMCDKWKSISCAPNWNGVISVMDIKWLIKWLLSTFTHNTLLFTQPKFG